MGARARIAVPVRSHLCVLALQMEAVMDWLYVGLMIGFILVSVALVHGFERLRARASARSTQSAGSAP
jgi:hypothetical protein